MILPIGDSVSRVWSRETRKHRGGLLGRPSSWTHNFLGLLVAGPPKASAVLMVFRVRGQVLKFARKSDDSALWHDRARCMDSARFKNLQTSHHALRSVCRVDPDPDLLGNPVDQLQHVFAIVPFALRPLSQPMRV